MNPLMSKNIYIHFRTNTTIGMASEILRLALIRSTYISNKFICIRIDLPQFIKDKRFPSLIYKYINCDEHIIKEKDLWFKIELLKSLIDQSIEIIGIRLPSSFKFTRRIPQGQEGLYHAHQDYLSELNDNSKYNNKIKKLARAVRYFGEKLIKNDNNEVEKLILAGFGLSRDDWFVCVHVRTSHFHGDKASFRNSNFNNYQLAIDHLISIGAKVIRLGDPDSSNNYYKKDGLIDYPNSPYKSEAMDLFLIKNCKFFIGTQSGILDTSYLFKKPTLCLNSVHFDFRSANPLDRILYKRILEKKSNKILSIQECINNFELIMSNKWEDNFLFIENTKFEILDATIEFINNLESPQRPSKKQVEFRRKIIRLRLMHCEKNGEIPSFFAASIAFSRCQIIDSQLVEYE
jgi:putative glycosyltransferase (TIGR04372 family)